MPFSPLLPFETKHGRSQGRLIVGLDEVGRGPLAGPVVACAVILPDDLSTLPEGITDSKKLSAKKREALAPVLRAQCRFAMGQASVEEIDRINILQATFLAMRRAIEGLGVVPDFALIDGPFIPPQLPCPGEAIVEGDSKSLSIAAASIIAKVERDALMVKLDQDYPGYGWASNAGYGAAKHLSALRELGVTPHHRQSFSPVRKVLEDSAVD